MTTSGGVFSSQMDNMKVEVIRTLEELQSVRQCWESLNSHPNSDIDFYSGVVKSGQQTCRPHVLVLRRGDYPEAILVGRAERTHIESKLGYKVLWRTPARQLTFIYGGQLGNISRQNCELIFKEILNCLRSGEADVAELHFIRADSALCDLALREAPLLCRDYIPCVQLHRSTTVPRSQEEFNNRWSAKVRRNQRWRKMANDFPGQIEIKCFREPHELDQMLVDAEIIASKTYQRALGTGFMADEVMKRRFRLEAEKGWLRAYLLYLQGKPAAFWICSLRDHTLYSGFMGYDPEFSKYSAGMFLVMRQIEAFSNPNHGEPIFRIDWGLGDAEYKSILGDCEWSEVSVVIFAPTIKGFVLNALRTPLAVLDAGAKAALANSPILQRVKTAWRRKLRTEVIAH